MDYIEELTDYAFAPIVGTIPLYTKASEGDTFLETVPSRALFLLEAIVCKIALPLITILGIIETIYNAFTEQDWEKSLQRTMVAVTLLIIAVPACVLAALLPSKFVAQTIKESRTYFDAKMVNYFPAKA